MIRKGSSALHEEAYAKALLLGRHRHLDYDPTEFATVTVDPELGVLCWSNGAGIDAELLRYDDLWNDALPVPGPA